MSARSTFASSVSASRFRGFDQVEVASFLAAVADDYEQALRETDRLRQDLMRMEAVARTSTASTRRTCRAR